MNDFRIGERFFVRDKNTLHRAVAGHRHAVEDVIQIVVQHLGETDQAGVELTGSQPLGQLAGRQELGFVFDPVSERGRVQVRHRADAGAVSDELQPSDTASVSGASSCSEVEPRCLDFSSCMFAWALSAIEETSDAAEGVCRVVARPTDDALAAA